MSISVQFFSEKLIEGYVKTPILLKEQTMTRLAIQLCQYFQLKKHVIEGFDPHSESDNSDVFHEWVHRLERQSIAICDTLPLPDALKQTLIKRICFIAIRKFGWNAEYKALLHVNSHVVDQFLTPSDWTAEGRIDERKVAERIVRYKGIPISRRKRLACLHHLEPFNRLVYSPKYLVEWFKEYSLIPVLWRPSYAAETYFKTNEERFWEKVCYNAVEKGLKTIVVFCWDILTESQKQQNVCSYAWIALKSMRNCRLPKDYFCGKRWDCELERSKCWCIMPSQHSDISYFFISQMSEKQRFHFLSNRLTFFPHTTEQIFRSLLQHPHQAYFIPLITKKWRFFFEKLYVQMLLILVNKCNSMGFDKVYDDFDYGFLLVELFEKTPEKYRRFIFRTHTHEKIFHFLLNEEPVQRRTLKIIADILRCATVEERRSFMYASYGENLCKCLIESKNFERLDLILEVCFQEGVEDFKKKFLLSKAGRSVCFFALAKDNGESIDSLMNWGRFTKEEVSEFKLKLIWDVLMANGKSMNSLIETEYSSELVNAWDPRQQVTKLLEDFNTDGVDKVLEWCLPSEGARKQYKEQFISIFGKYHLHNCFELACNLECDLRYLIPKMSKILRWSFFSEEDIKFFKRELYAKEFHKIVLRKRILHEQWQDVDSFVEWFQLSVREIEQFKKDVMCERQTINAILNLLMKSELDAVSFYLQWGLSNVEAVRDFEKKVKEYNYKRFCPDLKQKQVELLQRRLDKLIKDWPRTKRLRRRTEIKRQAEDGLETEHPDERSDAKRKGFDEGIFPSKKLK